MVRDRVRRPIWLVLLRDGKIRCTRARLNGCLSQRIDIDALTLLDDIMS